VSVAWDGTFVSGGTPSYFRYVKVLQSTSSTGTYIDTGQTLSGAGGVAISGLTDGQAYYFKFQAVDSAGHASGLSAASASITPEGVDLSGLEADISSAQSNAAAALSAANTAQTAADSAQSDADAASAAAASAAGIANSKAIVLYQTTAPGSTYQNSLTLWIDTTSGANTPKRWNGSTWVAVTDKVATDAAQAAATANTAAGTAQTAANTAQTTANNAVSAASAAQTTADTAKTNAATAQTAANNAASAASAANQAALDAAGIANSKGKVIIQSAAPATADQLPQNLWIDTTSGANTPKRWSGSAWVIVTDKAATDAATAAATAKTAADNAAADAATAQSAANAAQTAANAAQSTANAAQTTANAKNTVYYQTTKPTGGTYKKGDTWFDTDDGNKVYVHNGTDFVPVPFGSSAIASKAITSAQIADAVNTAISTAQSTATSASTAASAAQSDADAAAAVAVAAQATADSKASLEYIASRGTDLVTNGTGLLGDNTNFSVFTYDPTDAPTGAKGSFVAPTPAGTASNDELIPVSVSKSYLLSVAARQRTAGNTSRMYFGLIPYDAYGLQIAPYFYYYLPDSTTTLAAPLSNGQTTAQITSAANWVVDANAYLAIWNWEDQGGKVWPVGTYTRRALWLASSSGTTLTLKTPYAGPTIPSGTPVSQSRSGGSYMYTAASSAVVTEEWTVFSGTVLAGEHDGTTGAATNHFPPGTASVRLVMLPNRTIAGPNDPASSQAIGAVSFSDATQALKDAATAQDTADTAKANALTAQNRADDAFTNAGAAQTTANSALTAANGKSIIKYSTSAASGSGVNIGDVWFQQDASGVISNQWVWSGSAWVKQTLSNTVIASLDAGKITSGTINAARIGAGTITGTMIAGTTITGNKIVSNTITSLQMLAGTITAASGIIADAAITTAKIADLAVTNAQIADGTIQNAKIGNLDAGKITTGSIAAARIAAGTITSTMIAANTIIAGDIAAGTITATEIAANTITAAKIAAGTITANEIASGAITTVKLDATAINGMTITGATLQTTATASSGIKIDTTGLSAYNSSGVRTVFIDPTTGALTATSGTFSGDINGATVTGSAMRASSTVDGIQYQAGFSSSGNIYSTASDGSTLISSALTNGLVLVYSGSAVQPMPQPGDPVRGTFMSPSKLQTSADASKRVRPSTVPMTSDNLFSLYPHGLTVSSDEFVAIGLDAVTSAVPVSLISASSDGTVSGAYIASPLAQAKTITGLAITKGVGKANLMAMDEQSKMGVVLSALPDAYIPNLDASKITTGTLPLTRGGTGVTSLTSLKTSLGIGTPVTHCVVVRASNSLNTGINAYTDVSSSTNWSLGNGGTAYNMSYSNGMTVPINGLYLVEFTIMQTGSYVSGLAGISKNISSSPGGDQLYGLTNFTSGPAVSATGSALVSLLAGDTLKLWVYAAGASMAIKDNSSGTSVATRWGCTWIGPSF
jgi:hypothetical protein